MRCREKVMFLGLSTLAMGGVLLAQDPAANSKYSLVPDTVVRGKEYGVTITRKDCSAPPGDVSYANILTSGFTLTDIARIDKDCKLTAKLNVATDAPLGNVNIMLYTKDDRKNPVDVVTLSVESIERGPTPPGLKPQVDVFWKVYPRTATGHSFGRTVTNRYFAIDVTIGNNSGYPLQIASVAFTMNVPGFNPDTAIPSDAYNFVRGSIEKEQQVGARALVVNTVNALGPILTAGNGFFSSVSPEKHYTTFVGLFSNPFAKGLELVWPDRTVRQLVALDSRAHRDSVIIPNNVEQKILIFVSREALEKPPCRLFGILGCSKRETADQRLGQKRDFNPDEVMQKLGTLVLVGRPISYLNRVQVLATPNNPAVSPPPTLVTKSVKLTMNDTDQTLTLTGNALKGAELLAPTDAPFTIDPKNVQVSGDGNSITFKTKSAAKPGKYPVNLKTPNGMTSFDVNVVEPPKPALKPDSALQGEKVGVTLKGDITAETTVTSADKSITVGTAKFDSQDNSMSFDVTVDPEAAFDKPYDLTLTTGSRTETVQFKVTAAKPEIKVPSPNPTGSKTQKVTISVAGTHLAHADIVPPDNQGFVKAEDNTYKDGTMTSTFDASAVKPGTYKFAVKNGDQVAKDQITVVITE